MAHYAQIDEDGIVLQVLVVPDGQENRGQEYLAEDCGLGGTWVKTSYNGKIRKQFAGIGMKYDKNKDVFIAEQPYLSWSLDENNDWQAPVPYPTDGVLYTWNEEIKDWEAINHG